MRTPHLAVLLVAVLLTGCTAQPPPPADTTATLTPTTSAATPEPPTPDDEGPTTATPTPATPTAPTPSAPQPILVANESFPDTRLAPRETVHYRFLLNASERVKLVVTFVPDEPVPRGFPVTLTLRGPDGRSMEEGVLLWETGGGVEVWLEELNLTPEQLPAPFDVRLQSSRAANATGTFYLDPEGPPFHGAGR